MELEMIVKLTTAYHRWMADRLYRLGRDTAAHRHALAWHRVMWG